MTEKKVMYTDVFTLMGAPFVRLAEYVSEIFLLCYLSFRSLFFQPDGAKRSFISVVSAQIYFTGWQGLPLIGFLALATGFIVVMQSVHSLTKFGGWTLLGQILVSAVVRELGPLLTTIVIIARSGTAVASEIGTMRINKEIEALESMAIHPLYFIVLPRLVGGTLSTLGLAGIFVFISLVSGFLIAHWASNYSLEIFLRAISSALSISDIVVFSTKACVGGLIVFSISCYQGLKVGASPTEIPQRTTSAVVHSIVAVMTFNAIVTFLVFFEQLKTLGIL